ncbi:MAG: hypothetical protein R3B99_04680 [Polyangiales bacterium]
MFGGAGREYRWKHGTKRETFAKISEKARKHAAKNPYALFKEELDVEAILASPEVFDPLTRYQCCPPTVWRGERDPLQRRVREEKHGITDAVWIAGQAMTTDAFVLQQVDDSDGQLRHDQGRGAPGLRAERSQRPEGRGRGRAAAYRQRAAATRGSALHEGEAEKFIWDADSTYGGQVVTNPSGGLLSRGTARRHRSR